MDFVAATCFHCCALILYRLRINIGLRNIGSKTFRHLEQMRIGKLEYKIIYRLRYFRVNSPCSLLL